jgi:hypothetical protein
MGKSPMSMNKHTCLLLGVQIHKDSMDDSLFAKWYEYEENPDKHASLSLKWGEGSEYYYLGKVLAESEPYSDDENTRINEHFDLASIGYLCYCLDKEYGIDKSVSDIELYFFDYWG